jgi:putative chitinase
MSIKRLQTQLGVTVDGIAGPATMRALFQRFGANTDRAVDLGIAAAVHFPAFGLMDNMLRLAHFMAQLAHESGDFKYMEEIASGQAYEGRADLGNTQPGDGKRYKGRGPIQLTGRSNYRRFGHKAGINFERYPEIVANPSIGLHVACLYWDDRKLNALADADNLEVITRKINGGLNGLDDRKAKLVKAKALLL